MERQNQPGAPRGQHSPSRSPTTAPAPEVPLSERLRSGYFDSSGNLQPEFVSRKQMTALAKDMSEDRPPLTMHQVRRFFQHCRAVEARLRARTSTWKAQQAEFLRLDVAAADAFGKSPPKIPEIFETLAKLVQ